jgi:hypothetical protein
MSEQKQSSFMQELDQWTKTTVIHPPVYRDPEDAPNARSLEALVEDVTKAIRTKVLESYRNGQKAGPRKGDRYGR